MWERLISSVVRGDYYLGEVNIICCHYVELSYMYLDIALLIPYTFKNIQTIR
jgi:hypothetical protein